MVQTSSIHVCVGVSVCVWACMCMCVCVCVCVCVCWCAPAAICAHYRVILIGTPEWYQCTMHVLTNQKQQKVFKVFF